MGSTPRSILRKWAYFMPWNLAFTKGKFSSSSIAVMGHNPTMDLSVRTDHGTGVFRLTRGVLTLRTVMVARFPLRKCKVFAQESKNNENKSIKSLGSLFDRFLPSTCSVYLTWPLRWHNIFELF
ncbi:hypothetical protein LguiB_007301 [Lonicera macranthoides]